MVKVNIQSHLQRKIQIRILLELTLKVLVFGAVLKLRLKNDMKNVGFIRTQIELVDLIFAENEVDEIWITFPDPQIKYKRTKHRMTNSEFLKKYHTVLKEDGCINLKTDSEFYAWVYFRFITW